jgi:hypothetical protein
LGERLPPRMLNPATTNKMLLKFVSLPDKSK